jgi:hypothetical protein
MNRALIFIVFMMGTAHAEPLPLPKPPGPGGSCPHFYLASGSYCVPWARRMRCRSRPTAPDGERELLLAQPAPGAR